VYYPALRVTGFSQRLIPLFAAVEDNGFH